MSEALAETRLTIRLETSAGKLVAETEIAQRPVAPAVIVRAGVTYVIVAGAVAIAVTLIGYAVWWEAQPHETYQLDARLWSCSDTDVRLTPVLVGKVTMMSPRTVCVEYRRSAQ